MARVHRTLVDVATLAAHLEDPRWAVVDCRWTLTDPRAGPARYIAGHIPGARYADLAADLAGPPRPGSGRHPLPDPHEFARRLGAWGIADDTQVVAYDDAGGAWAARLWWLMRWLGHEAVAVLDGGLPAWVAAGQPIESEVTAVAARRFAATPDDRRWLDSAEVEDLLADPALVLLDARAPARYAGAEEPVDPRAGHIPGALNAAYAANLAADGRFLDPAALRARYDALLAGREPAAAVVYCGSGVTACHDLLALEIAGLPGARLYAGSWSEWVSDPARPVRVGTEP